MPLRSLSELTSKTSTRALLPSDEQAIPAWIESDSAREIEAVIISDAPLGRGGAGAFAFITTERPATTRGRRRSFAIEIGLANYGDGCGAVFQMIRSNVIHEDAIVAAVGKEQALALFIEVHGQGSAAATTDAAVGSEDLKIDTRRTGSEFDSGEVRLTDHN